MGKVTVYSKKGSGRLYLLAKLPPRDGSDGPWTQKLIPVGPDTPATRKIAGKQRKRLQKELDDDIFNWSNWIEGQSRRGMTWKAAIEALYRKKVFLGKTGENTWNIAYMGRLRQAPMGKVVTSKEIQTFVNRWEVSTASYKEAYYLAKQIATITDCSFPELRVPRYRKSIIEDVPDDSLIIDWIEDINKKDPVFAWVVGMMATYGLRPHELYECKFIDEKHRLRVVDDSKTGWRLTIPVHNDWVNEFDLRNERRWTTTSYRKGKLVSQYYHRNRRKYGIEYKAYALRHAYAGRLWKTGGSRLDVFTASKLMGHSMKEHEKTYRLWIHPNTIAQRAEEALQQSMLDQVERNTQRLRDDADRLTG